MALVDVDGDPWLREHEACESLSREIAAQLTLREEEPPKSSRYDQISATVRLRLRQFDSEVQQLREKLSVIAKLREITPDEQERRTRLLEWLESRERLLNQRFHSRDLQEQVNRVQLLKPQYNARRAFADMGTVGWGEDSEESTPTNIERAQQEHQQILRAQDAGLEELASVITRQILIANTIGEEVEYHNEIIDDLANSLDRTAEGLINETRQVRVIDKKDTTWWYWLIIIFLFLVIIVVGLV